MIGMGDGQQQHGEEEEREMPQPTTPACYGCEHMVASPFGCEHPSALMIKWDPMTQKTYRMPSVERCKYMGGICKYYEPSKECGYEYFMMKEIEEGKDRIQLMVDEIVKDGKVNEFLKRLNHTLLTEGDDEDEEDDE